MAPRRRIVVDWGTSNLRAYLLGEDGKVSDRRESRQGIMRVGDAGFRPVLDALIAGWRDAEPLPPVLLSGMVGSRQGWVEAPYVACPATARDLADGLVPAPGMTAAWIVPGVVSRSAEGGHDVMRGEEVQVFGALAGAGGRHVLCLPGTHSKWAVVEDGTLTRFATAMTGEVYQVMAEHSILGRLMPAEADDPAATAAGLARGVARARTPGGLLNHLFSVRAEGLFGSIPPAELRGFLSGILIGHEVAGLRPLAEGAEAIHIVAASALASIYADALALLGLRSRVTDAETATAAGLHQTALAAGL